jgi:DNA-binding transcriptional LysR family regulator
MLSLASAGIGVALVPESMRMYQTAAEVEFRDLYPETPYLTFHLAWRRSNLSAALKSFFEIFTAHTEIKIATK